MFLQPDMYVRLSKEVRINRESSDGDQSYDNIIIMIILCSGTVIIILFVCTCCSGKSETKKHK